MDERASGNNPFHEIYRTEAWGNNENETRSGRGSTRSHTVELRAWLEKFIELFRVESILDAACGEWGWMAEVNLGSSHYIGLDVVPDVIESNKERFPEREFRIGDIAQNTLPKTDLIICKDCFQHLSTPSIQRALENIVVSGAPFLLTSSDFHPSPLSNQSRKVRDGGYYPENLHAPPLNLRRWIGNVCLDRKTFSLWCLQDDSRIQTYRELFAQCALTALTASALDPASVPDATNLLPNYALYGQHDGETIILPGETGVLIPDDPFTLPNETITALELISPGDSVKDIFVRFQSKLEASEDDTRLFLFYCHELGLLRGQGFGMPDSWERKRLIGIGQRASAGSPLGLRKLSDHLLRPPAWLQAASLQNDPWTGLLQLFNWSYGVGSPLRMRRGDDDQIELSVAIDDQDFRKLQQLFP